MNSISKERNAESSLLKPQLSSFLTTGSKMNEINKAMLSGINTCFASIKTAKKPTTKAKIKNSLWKDSYMSDSKIMNSD